MAQTGELMRLITGRPNMGRSEPRGAEEFLLATRSPGQLLYSLTWELHFEE